MYRPTRATGPAKRKGTRQPHEFKAASDKPRSNNNEINPPITKPKTAVEPMRLAQRPLRLCGEYSVKNVAAPENSPPAEKPWSSRNTKSRIGAHMPTCP